MADAMMWPVAPVPGAAIGAFVAAMAVERARAVDEALERMLVSDEGGVLVLNHGMGGWTVRLDPSVPWGEVHERRER